MTDEAKIDILLVDDDKFLLDMYAMKFTQNGYNVQTCLSATDALSILAQGFHPAVILFDLIMPECDGFMFLQKLSEQKLAGDAVKIALTNQSTDSERAKAMELGASQFIVKATMIPSEVVNTVDSTLKRGKTS